jgi:glycosyltransferase involved in cell wall biosynthesis
MFYNPNITIALSGYNIKNIALLAIDSFLRVYPKMKSQIVYFDDFSTDGTTVALKSRGIKVITWDKDLLDQYISIADKHPEWSIGQRLSVRVSYIIENIIRETKTNYLVLNDGDVIFINNEMLEHFMELAEHYDIVYQRDDLYQPNEFQQGIIEKINDRYIRKVETDETGHRYWRMFHAHVFLNVKKLKEIGITSDRLNEETAIITEGGLFDTFSDFTNRVLESGLLKIKEEPILENDVIHFGGQASDRKGLKNGVTIEPLDDGGYYMMTHVHRPNLGQPVNKEYVIIDFNKEMEELKTAYEEICHILFNGYNIKDIYLNKNRKTYKIIFKKIC